MPNYSTSTQPVNYGAELEHTLENLDKAYRKLANDLAQLVERLHAAAAPYIAADLERRHQAPANPLEALAQAVTGAAVKKALLPRYESQERECDTCGETALCSYEDVFDLDNPNVICGACSATERARPYAPLADVQEEEVA
jgi:hypothetical protein